MRRKLIVILAAVSFIAAVAVAVLWVRSLGTRGQERRTPIASVGNWSLYVDPSEITLLSLHLDGVNDYYESERESNGTPEDAMASTWRNEVIDDQRKDLTSGGLLRDGRQANEADADVFFARDVFEFGSNARYGGMWSYWRLQLPCWVVIGGALILPTIAAARLRQSQRRAVAGACAVCGYDLRATPETCPECGTSREMKGE